MAKLDVVSIAVLGIVAIWLLVTSLILLSCGWFRLMAAFPDRAEPPILHLRFICGRMGPAANMNGVLTVSVCPSGLRLGVLRVFGPFAKSFLVPWSQLSVMEELSMFPGVRVQFGDPELGSLVIDSLLAAQLAGAAGANWPNVGPIPH